MENDPIAIAKRCYLAYVNDDRSEIESIIAADFHFTSPLDNRLDRDAYFARCWPTSETIIAFEFIRLAQDGDQVFVTYEGAKSSGGRFRNTEVLTIQEGQIIEAEVYFGWSLPHEAAPGTFL